MSISLGELATRFGCDLDGDPEAVVDRVSTLSDAGPQSLSFLSNPKLSEQLSSTKAAAVLIRPDSAADCPVARLLTDNPYATYARIAQLLHPLPAPVPGIHSSAVVDATATVAASAQICPNAVIGERSIIGDNVIVGPGSVVGPDCRIGDDCRLIANVTLARKVTVGKRCILHPGAVIGADGFGNAMGPDGWIKIPQIGGVTMGDDCEIGANTTVDCGAIDDTVLEDDVRLDNLVMIGHNTRVGAHTAMACGVAIAGSVTIGKRCLFAGKVGTVGHIRICDDAIFSGRATVTKDITEPGEYASAFPAEKARDWGRRVAQIRRIGRLSERVKELEKKDK